MVLSVTITQFILKDLNYFKRTFQSFLSSLSGRLLPSSPCCSPASKISVWSLVTLMTVCFSCIAAVRVAWGTLLCKSCKRVAQLDPYDCRFAERATDKSREICPYRRAHVVVIWNFAQLRVNRKNRGIFIFISYGNGLIGILSFLEERQQPNPSFCVHAMHNIQL